MKAPHLRNLTALLLLPVAVAAVAGDSLETRLQQAAQALIPQKIKGTSELVIGREGWVVLTSELQYLAVPQFWGPDAAAANRHVKPELVDPIPAIVDLDRQLRERNIELWFMPVPVRPLVYPEAVLGHEVLPPAGAALPSLHSLQARFFQELRDRGITVIDLLPVFLEHRDDPQGPIYCSSDAHWTGLGVTLAAQEVARLLKTRPWFGTQAQEQLSATWTTIEHRGSHYRQAGTGHGLAEHDLVQLRQISLPSGQELALRNPASPVVVIGDSNTVWWQQQRSALPHQLAFELGFPVDLLNSHGGGATNTRLNLIRAATADSKYLASKRVVIWCFTMRAVVATREGWVKLPLPPALLPGADVSSPHPAGPTDG